MTVLKRALSALFFKSRTWKIGDSELWGLKFRDIEVSKMIQKHHFWIAELQSFKLNQNSLFSLTLQLPGQIGPEFGSQTDHGEPSSKCRIFSVRVSPLLSEGAHAGFASGQDMVGPPKQLGVESVLVHGQVNNVWNMFSL